MQKEPVFLIKVGPKKGLGSIKGRTLLIFGNNQGSKSYGNSLSNYSAQS
jgi:hypothetical protein